MRYIIYCRKSTDTEDKQLLSLDAQERELKEIASKYNLEVVQTFRESMSAKNVGRPIFSEMIKMIITKKADAILCWKLDRLARNMIDGGQVIDLLTNGIIKEIKTHEATHTPKDNTILLAVHFGSANQYSRDLSENVKRGMRARVEMGLFPGRPPTGYLSSNNRDEKCLAVIDEQRGNIIKEVFEKIAYENISARKVYDWFIKEKHFKPISNKTFSLGNYYLMLHNTFYYGVFEYPKDSGNWYKGKHEPLITRELFDLVQEKIKEQTLKSDYSSKEFAFTRLLTCSLCGSGITADKRIKTQKNGNKHEYIYYKCTKVRNRNCNFGFIKEIDLIEKLKEIIDTVDINKIQIKEKITTEIKRFKLFQSKLLNQKSNDLFIKDIDIREYVKFILDNGTLEEKRDILGCFKEKININNI